MNIGKVALMSDSVKRRRYDATGRQQAASATRATIISAAQDLFTSTGYTATTMAMIAERAEVAVDTVYATAGTKPVLFRQLIESALSGQDQTVPGAQRDYAVRMQAAPDLQSKLAIYATAVTDIQGRLAPLFLTLRSAATAHPELDRLWKEIGNRRAANMRLLTADLATTGQLRTDLTLDEIADIIWTMNSTEYYALLVLERNWAPNRFATWLRDAWTRLLTADEPTD